jgi:glycosidase
MLFTSNHDLNTWEGSAKERLGDAMEVCTALTYTLPGMPLIYNGQEAGLKKRIRFFEKDPIEWVDSPMQQIYKSLNQLKRSHKALLNGEKGGVMQRIKTNYNRSIFSFIRQNANDKILVVANLSNKAKKISFSGSSHWGDYTNWMTKERVSIAKSSRFSLDKWDYRILVSQQPGRGLH